MLQSGRSLADAVARCGTEGKLTLVIKDALSDIGMENFFFITLMKDQKDRSFDKYIFGCDPRLGSFFNQMSDTHVDPFVVYGTKKSRPILISELRDQVVDDQYDQSLFSTLSRHGFRSGIAIPSHTTSISRIGILVVGVERDDSEIFRMQEVLLRGMSAIMLDWWIDNYRAEHRNLSRLNPEDFEILKYKLKDYSAKEIASVMPLNEAKIGNRCRVINEVFETSNIKASAEIALQLGLISAV